MNDNYDAIVVGSGISGGWAAKELTEKGLNVLVLERGSMIRHGQDYKGEHMPPWNIPYGGMKLQALYDEEYEVQQHCYAFDETNRHFWNNDKENPYVYEKGGFEWIRGDVVGGRSLMWGRHVYRWSDLDFEANSQDGHGVDWPIRYADIEPWYSYVEEFIGVSGQKEGLQQLPDGHFLPPMQLNAGEEFFKTKIQKKFPERVLTIGRVAILTQPHNGRGACHYCGPCQRGCSVGAYFSSQSSTLPAAFKTGRITLKANQLVEQLNYDATHKRVTSVSVIDTQTSQKREYRAKLIFLCASTVATAQILLNSTSDTFPTGLGNSSDQVGRNLMDHTMSVFASARIPNIEEKTEFGQRPTGIYLPRFTNLNRKEGKDFVRGYGFQGRAKRDDWLALNNSVDGFGADFKAALITPGEWRMKIVGLGECLPYSNNRVTLERDTLDKFGIPQVKFTFSYGQNEQSMIDDIANEAKVMFETAGCEDIKIKINPPAPGRTIHEMGTARMGRDPKTSVLNKWNQMHDVPNVFITDGSCMASSSCVNPSLTYMALTARAVDYAVNQLKSRFI